MSKLLYSASRNYFETIFLQALKAVDPYQLIKNSLRSSKGKKHLNRIFLNIKDHADLHIIALGKAAGGMTRAFLDLTQVHPTAGVIALPVSDPTPFSHPFTVFHAGHPHPTQASINAGFAAREMLESCTPDDVIIVLISGGGSALFELPLPGIDLGDLHQLNQQILRSGLSIMNVNIIRSSLSQVKGGGLARLAYPARVVSLILSDVIGDALGSIASGPTVLTSDRRCEARELLMDIGLWHRVPASVRTALNEAKHQRGKARRPTNFLLGGNRQLIDGAVSSAQSLGFQVEVLSRQMHGEARQTGRKFARRLMKLSEGVNSPTCFIMGGETTVTVRGTGKGGRNQEFALAAATVLEGHDRIALASLASDGIDGPTDAAGAIVDGNTCARIRTIGLHPGRALDQNDSYPALKAGNALLHTGPTGTNVADLTLGLIFPNN